MKTKAVRLYGANDLRLEEFDLPEIKDDEILVRIVSDSICMSTYKLLIQGTKHKRCPPDVATHPVMIGHEFAGDIVRVGKKWQHEFKEGEKFAQQPALNYQGKLDSPGYSYQFCGGAATYCIMPNEVMELGCLLHYDADNYFNASLAEPVSCVIGGYNTNYHTNKQNYQHSMGIKKDGCLLILGGAGPMGLGAVDYALALNDKPALVVVTDINNERLGRAEQLITVEQAKKQGVNLVYLNTAQLTDSYGYLMELSGGKGYDDVFVYAPLSPLAELGDRLLAFDGCMNFFAGPADSSFSSPINLYNCHYNSTHILGSTGGNTDDIKEALKLAAAKRINPSVMVTHIGGLNSVIETTSNLPQIPGGKKLIYNHIEMPLTAIDDFAGLAKENPLFAALADSCARHNGLWNSEAEQILLKSEFKAGSGS